MLGAHGTPDFRIRPLAEGDIDQIIRAAGGTTAHQNVDARAQVGSDYRVGTSLIELKSLDDDGFLKPGRREKLAALFGEIQAQRPVVVLDQERLSESERRQYDRIIEGPVKAAVSKARKQLRQSRTEIMEEACTVLLLINNGYTALDHESLLHLVAHRVLNDTTEIDGIVVAGCYFYSDGLDSYFLWPMDYVPIWTERPFREYEALRTSWNSFADHFMTAVARGTEPEARGKGPVIDTSFDVGGVTFVKPAPPMGKGSGFYRNGRPRWNSTGVTSCPPVAMVFPGIDRSEWFRFRQALPEVPGLKASFEEWQRHRARAIAKSTATQPLIPVAITFDGWCLWREDNPSLDEMDSIREYAVSLFHDRLRPIINRARDRSECSILPHRYIFSTTEVIGQDMKNDVSHIALVRERPNQSAVIRPIISNARIFHEHAVALAAAYAIGEGVDTVLWDRDLRYAWT